MIKHILFIAMFLVCLQSHGQDNDLMALLNEQTEEPVAYALATFKGSRLINGHTVQNRKAKAFEFLISHRFGQVKFRSI